MINLVIRSGSLRMGVLIGVLQNVDRKKYNLSLLIEDDSGKENLEEKVKLIGKMKNPYVWIKNSKFFVHSSKFEGLPTVIIEVMICGKVILSSNCPTGPKEILEKNSCGILFKMKDENDLSEKLLLNQKLMEEYRNRIIERIDEFKADNVMKEYDKVILE